MKIISTVAETRAIIKEWKKNGLKVGLVPTMGYLHEGHLSLIKKAVSENDRVVVSIFVNPTQFGPNEDYETYPRDIDKDSALCESAGADIIFHPEASEMYPKGACTYVNMTGLTDVLCGKSRPTHFQGVCTVVSKLFNITTPDNAYFGQKDAQQLAVIKRMVKDLNFDINITGCPIVREEDGLAKSSRNTYLNKEERKAALVLHRAITCGQSLVNNGERNASVVINRMKDIINAEPLAKTDYVEIVDMNTMESVSVIKGEILCAIAVYIGKTRLIDNFIVNVG